MSLDRAWSRRGLVSPAPWAESVPSLWQESTVTFSRNDAPADTHGGFSSAATPPQVLLITSAHVEFDEWEDKTNPTQRRILRIFMPFPLDRTKMPRRGDVLQWTDDTGTTYNTHVRTVESPLNMADHLEIESEAFV